MPGREPLLAGPVASPADLHGLPSLALGPPRADFVWNFEGAQGRTASVPHAPRIVTDDLATLHAAAIEGLGVVQLPTMLIGPDVQAGRVAEGMGFEPTIGLDIL